MVVDFTHLGIFGHRENNIAFPNSSSTSKLVQRPTNSLVDIVDESVRQFNVLAFNHNRNFLIRRRGGIQLKRRPADGVRGEGRGRDSKCRENKGLHGDHSDGEVCVDVVTRTLTPKDRRGPIFRPPAAGAKNTWNSGQVDKPSHVGGSTKSERSKYTGTKRTSQLQTRTNGPLQCERAQAQLRGVFRMHTLTLAT